jgi:hypothetical protein
LLENNRQHGFLSTWAQLREEWNAHAAMPNGKQVRTTRISFWIPLMKQN